MPFLHHNHAQLFFQYDYFEKKETIIFSNSLGADVSMWSQQVSMLSPYFNILRYDTRGLGKSELGDISELTIEILGNDVLAILDELKLEKAHFCGLSMGGLIGQWLEIYAPERFHTFTLANTAAKIGTAEGWKDRIAQVSNHGLASLMEATAERWFTKAFIEKNSKKVTDILNVFKNTNLHGYIANCNALANTDFRESLKKFKIPTLIISGKYDPVTTIEDADFLVENIPNSKLNILEAAHLSNVEQAEEFSKALLYHIQN